MKNNIIADRKIQICSGNERRDCLITIYIPELDRLHGVDWVCYVEFDEKIYSAYGVDAMQALTQALKFIRMRVGELISKGNQIFWLGGEFFL